MPRILDRIDAAAGRTPEFLDEDVDYLTPREGPAALIGADGRYDAGWFRSFDGELNLQDSPALQLSLQRWFHLTLDTPEHFIVMNLADMGKAANTALLVVDKATGRFDVGSRTALAPGHPVRLSPDLRLFKDLPHGCFISVDESGDSFAFSVHVDGLHCSGRARRVLGPALVQATRYQRGRGALQWYGNLALDAGMLTLGERVIVLPADSLGTYDRTVGHQRGIQSWNWLAAAGQARCVQTGRTFPMGVQVARDREGARPRVESKKHAVWVGGRLYKIPSACFEYTVLDEAERRTSDWRIHSPDAELAQLTGPAASWLDLRFQPLHRRRELKRLLIARTDFNQYYGPVSGRVMLEGRLFDLLPTFAVTEESHLEL